MQTIQLLIKEIINELDIGEIETYAISPTIRTVISEFGAFHLEIVNNNLTIYHYHHITNSSAASFALSNPELIANVQEYFNACHV